MTVHRKVYSWKPRELLLFLESSHNQKGLKPKLFFFHSTPIPFQSDDSSILIELQLVSHFRLTWPDLASVCQRVSNFTPADLENPPYPITAPFTRGQSQEAEEKVWKPSTFPPTKVVFSWKAGQKWARQKKRPDKRYSKVSAKYEQGCELKNQNKKLNKKR